MILSEVDSWVREDPDNPHAYLGALFEEGPTQAESGQSRGDAVDLDEFLGDYEPSHGRLSPAADTAFHDRSASYPSAAREEQRDSWPHLAHAGLKTLWEASCLLPDSVEPVARRIIRGWWPIFT